VQAGIIDDPETFDILKLKRKSISLHWEFQVGCCIAQKTNLLLRYANDARLILGYSTIPRSGGLFRLRAARSYKT
jgi:hypothetical protein